jgi:hypothetical protein
MPPAPAAAAAAAPAPMPTPSAPAPLLPLPPPLGTGSAHTGAVVGQPLESACRPQHPGPILVKYWSNTGQILVKYESKPITGRILLRLIKQWSNNGQIFQTGLTGQNLLSDRASCWSITEPNVMNARRDQILVKYWSNTGQILAKYWSNTGQNTAPWMPKASDKCLTTLVKRRAMAINV